MWRRRRRHVLFFLCVMLLLLLIAVWHSNDWPIIISDHFFPLTCFTRNRISVHSNNNNNNKKRSIRKTIINERKSYILKCKIITESLRKECWEHIGHRCVVYGHIKKIGNVNEMAILSLSNNYFFFWLNHFPLFNRSVSVLHNINRHTINTAYLLITFFLLSFLTYYNFGFSVFFPAFSFI